MELYTFHKTIESTDEEISEWEYPNQQQIYIRIIDVNGKIEIHKCDYKVWLNVYKDDIIK